MNMFCTDMYCQKAAKDSCVSGLMFVVSHVTIKGLLIFSTDIWISVQINFNQDFFSEVYITSFLWFQFFFTLGSSQSCQTSVFTWKASFYCCLLWINVCNTLHGHDCKLWCLFNKKIISLLNIDKSIINRLSKSIILRCLHWSSNIDDIRLLSHSSKFVFKYWQTDIPILLSGEEYIVDSSLCFGPNSCPSMVSLVQILFWATGL